MPSKRSTGSLSSPPELAILLCGIGGQGVQLIGKTLAQAATLEGRYAMLAADYGGEMRGGPTQASVVLGSQPLRSLPILPAVDVAVVAHDRFTGAVPERLRPGSLLVLNSSIVDPAAAGTGHRVVAVPATRIAADLGTPQAGGFVLLGALVAAAHPAGRDALVEAMTSLLPPYRRAHAEGNAVALDEGIRAGRAALSEPGGDPADATVPATAAGAIR